mmetsp:Transcript_1791/g.4657  ORF Transcript_1791/g.4657 Transcript_1791/m.4657 type:complete len:702 (-) Transcript_1791:638-2743(-)|eukprot:CAMPEP_0197180608 /NCGR_PEP_ID=MMETSP1423-20130617/5162_1 /TAXON_ID=476441 /ORGANISM="Pseudo-nitzschia heimii, Strain UNC1101" /LENGTH=701 /DNA_ID=CAMNT_0042630711 /DNA_START=223 /DNA_END=2328 /DNA_ORIENTATION=-
MTARSERETEREGFIESLGLPSCLRDRVLCRVPPSPPPSSMVAAAGKTGGDDDDDDDSANRKPERGSTSSFVLYLPTVTLRKKHNPAFALACRLANHHGVPLLVLATVLDDTHLSPGRKPLAPIAMTSRRLAFVLEALRDSCCADWESHGAGVAIRVHGPGCRTPHHLSLVHTGAAAVVSDEPFVDPYREYVRRVASTCAAAAVPFWTVDGSTSVPPNAKLARRAPPVDRDRDGLYRNDLWFAGAPSKAWRWEKQTDPVRKLHVLGATRDRDLDAPALEHALPPDFFLRPGDDAEGGRETPSSVRSRTERLRELLPSRWRDAEASAPGQRPWTVGELRGVPDCKAWATSWKGADPSVPPCRQTHGSAGCARRRWRSFLRDGGLKAYARKRNGITDPHAVSRISCYLNLGILSVFDVLRDVWEAKTVRGCATGCGKFLEEVVKWREGSYVHAFAHPDYHTAEVLPPWARRHLTGLRDGAIDGGYGYEELARAATKDETWNAMQGYLIDTGELHNNARMTWGKTVVHWQSTRYGPDESLWQLCCLNDRFALDGLSPPSYGGLLWCFGWQDKPASGSRVSEKWAHRYRTGPTGFSTAKERVLRAVPPLLLLEDDDDNDGEERPGMSGRKRPAVVASRGNADEDGSRDDGDEKTALPTDASKKARRVAEADATATAAAKRRDPNRESILSFFGPSSATKAWRTVG